MHNTIKNLIYIEELIKSKANHDELAKIIARALVLNILTGGKAQAFSNLGGLFRARGGTVSANKPYIVGERGAEVFVPNKTGTIVSNQNMGAPGAAGMPVNITYNIQAFDSKDTITAITENAPTISAIIENEFNRRGRRGFVTWVEVFQHHLPQVA